MMPNLISERLGGCRWGRRWESRVRRNFLLEFLVVTLLRPFHWCGIRGRSPHKLSPSSPTAVTLCLANHAHADFQSMRHAI
jgi:hypothetical protein